ncbi:MAG: monovalent cation/H+ antiporter complex subunit F [Thermodesulfobacteriota bacterium]
MSIYEGCALLLLLCIVFGLVRILRGPTRADAMLAAQLFGTCGVAIVLLLGKEWKMGAARDIALVFALLAALSVLAFVRRAWNRQ